MRSQKAMRSGECECDSQHGIVKCVKYALNIPLLTLSLLNKTIYLLAL